MSLHKPEPAEHPGYFAAYIGLVPEGDLTELLDAQTEQVLRLYGSIREEDAGYRYGPDKWSVKQLLGHVADTERVMSYRMLCAARGDSSPLPGFDENEYVRGADFERQSLTSLLEGFVAVRRATLSLIASLPEQAWGRSAIVNGNAITARALAYVIAGHELHHGRILEERYAAVVGKQ